MYIYIYIHRSTPVCKQVHMGTDIHTYPGTPTHTGRHGYTYIYNTCMRIYYVHGDATVQSCLYTGKLTATSGSLWIGGVCVCNPFDLLMRAHIERLLQARLGTAGFHEVN